MTRRWGPLLREEHPAPEIACRLAEPWEVPNAAHLMSRKAQGAGWLVYFTYCRGTMPGRAAKVVDSLALRMRREPLGACAIWIDGAFDFGLRFEHTAAGIVWAPMASLDLSRWLVTP
jgi:hypothetical protein